MKVRININSVVKVLSDLILIEGALLLIPFALEIIDRESGIPGFAIAISLCALLGLSGKYFTRGCKVNIHRREGFLLVSLGWIVFSLTGMFPYLLCAYPLSVSDAFFETMSGFTTTGATTISDVERLSKGVLLWRSMTQWIGGLGIILFLLAVLPSLNEKGGIPMFNAETTGIKHDKLHPRIRNTARYLWLVYIVLSISLTILLWIGPMDFFESVNHAMTAISTGGFSTKNSGIGYWNSNYTTVILTLFMFIGGVNFSLLYGLVRGNWKAMVKNDVLHAYIFIVITAFVAILTVIVCENRYSSIADSIVNSMFHVVSTITTTGFSLTDFSIWGPFAVLVTITLMLCGACAGSTTGALKIDRVIALAKNLHNSVKRAVAPKRVMVVKVNSQTVPSPELERLSAFATIYLTLILIGSLILCAFDLNLEDAFFAVISCVGNNGLGYGLTGAEGGFHLLPDATKWICSFLMLAGRLELFSVLVLFFPFFWKK